MYLSKVEIVWETNDGTPSCSAPTFSPAAGIFTGSQSVTLTSSTDGATIYYTTDGTDPTEASTQYTGSITVSETTTIKAIAVKEGMDNSTVAEATYTITQPITIAELNTKTTNGTYLVNFQNAIVTYVNGSNCYIEDATGAILYYKSNNGRAAGETINGMAEVTFTLYNGLPEITQIEGTEFQTGSTIPTPTVVTLAELTANYTSYLSKYIKIENAKVTSALDNKAATIEQNGTSMALRQNGSETITKLTADANINLITFPALYNETRQLSVYSDNLIEVIDEKQDNIINVKGTVIGPGRTTEGNVFEVDRTATHPVETSLAFISTCSASTDVNYIQYTIDTENTTVPASEYELAEGSYVLVFNGNTAGTIVVKAFAPGNDQYKDGEATITVNITGITRDGHITVYNDNIIMNSVDTQGSTVVALLSLNSDDIDLTENHIKFYTNDGETAATYDWINAQLILDGAQYKVTISTTANQSSDARTAYLKVYVYDGDYDVYSPIITVTQRGKVSGEVVDEITKATTGVTGSSYQEWSGKRATSDAVYAGQSAGGNDAIQLRSNNNNSGVISTTSGGFVQSIDVDWNSNTESGRTINIYGSNTAYEAATDLYDKEKQGTLLGTIVCGTSTSLVVEGDYKYIGIRSANNALYLDKITITWLASNQQIAGLAYETTSYEVTFGDEFTAPELTNPNNLEVTYTSSDESVATVASDGSVTILAAGSATITASSAETDAFRAGQASYTLTVTEPVIPGTDKFELVTDASTLAANDVVILVGANTVDEVTTTYALGTNQKPNNREAVTVTVDTDGTITPSSNVQQITLEDGWYFNVGDGYLYAASSSSNHLKTETEADDNAKATISIGEDGNATITFQGTYTRNTLRFNPNTTANPPTPLFSCYASDSSTGSLPQIYRKVTSVIPTLPGDVNRDGAVTIADVTALVNIILGKDTEGAYDHEAADVNGDEGITIADVTALVNIILGKNN